MTIIKTNLCEMNLNRKEKIELLKSILQGKLCVSDLLEPKELKTVIHIGRQRTEDEFYVDGILISKQLFDEVSKRVPKTEKPIVSVRIGSKLLSKD